MKKKNIKDLLEKYISGKLDRDELDFLYHSINHHLHDDEIISWYYRYWDESDSKNSRIKSGVILDRIKEDINDPKTFVRGKVYSRSEKNNFLKFSIQFIKYAAVLLIGFTIALFIMKDRYSFSIGTASSLNEVTIPLGSKSKIVLSDGSLVWLNSGSTLKYPDSFNEKQREIYLAGEAFFEITRDESQPFVVKTSEINIRVLGTQFNVKSYPEENIVETTVISGLIEIETVPVKSHQKQQLRLESNQKATFAKATSKLDLLTKAENPKRIKPKPVGKAIITDRINTDVVIAWKDEKLVFAKERFEDILIKLERWYDVEIVLEDEKLGEYTYTGTFQNESLEQALNALKLATPFEYTLDKNNIIIYSRDE